MTPDRAPATRPHPRVVITGATSGIGRATALLLAGRGASLALAGRREDALEELAAECRRRGAAAAAAPCDVARPADVEALARRARARFGGFDVWVNNAGVLAIGALDESDGAGLVRVVETNLVGTLLGTRAAVAHFKERGCGTVVNVASLLSVFPSGYASAYVASKRGIDALSAAVRQELVAYPSVRVCSILPAGVDTPILDHAANYSGKAIRPHYPLVAPERVARAIDRCVRQPRDRVLVGGTGRLQALADAVAPGLHRRIVAVATAKALARASPAPRTDGELFVPSPRPPAVHGGWRRSRARVLAALGGSLVAVAIASAASARRAPVRLRRGKDL